MASLTNQTTVRAFSVVSMSAIATILGGSVILFIPTDWGTNKTRKEETAREKGYRSPGAHLVYSGALGLSAGVIMFVALVELFQDAIHSFSLAYADGNNSETFGYCMASGLFLIGWLINQAAHRAFECIDRRWIEMSSKEDGTNGIEEPTQVETESDHEYLERVARYNFYHDTNRIFREGALVAATLFFHNIPEGFMNFTAAAASPRLGYTMGIAIFVHNFPAGFAIAFPIFLSTGSRIKALTTTLIVGVAAYIGALLAWPLNLHVSYAFQGTCFAIGSGTMIFTVVNDLYIPATRYDPLDRITCSGMVVGMAIMGGSMILLNYYGPGN